MLANPLFFLLGLLLLWFPRRFMRLGATVGRAKHTRRIDEPWERGGPGDPRLGFRREMAKPRNYFDLLRGAAGGLALLGGHGIPPSLVPAGPGGTAALQAFALQIGILVVGLLIQTIRRERGHFSFFAPIFYLVGVSVALGGVWSALFAFTLIWALNTMLPNAQAFLGLLGPLLAGFGYMLGRSGPRLAAAALLLCWLPVLLSLLTRRPLVVFSRRGASAEPGAS